MLEDKIMKIEREFPTWASVHFNQPNKNVIKNKWKRSNLYKYN